MQALAFLPRFPWGLKTREGQGMKLLQGSRFTTHNLLPAFCKTTERFRLLLGACLVLFVCAGRARTGAFFLFVLHGAGHRETSASTAAPVSFARHRWRAKDTGAAVDALVSRCPAPCKTNKKNAPVRALPAQTNKTRQAPNNNLKRSVVLQKAGKRLCVVKRDP